MNESNPWKTLGQRHVYDNKWISLTEYDVINPSGGNGIYGKVHFKNLAIGIIPLDMNMNTCLVGQYRYTIDRFSWEIPEGGGEFGIDALESAKRELKEETGMTAGYWEKILTMHLSNSCTDEVSEVFLARELTKGEAAPDETEQLYLRILPFDEAYLMVQNGEITDAITVAAIQKVKLMMIDGQI